MSSIVEQNIAILRRTFRGIVEGRIDDRKIGDGVFLCNNTDGRRISFRGALFTSPGKFTDSAIAGARENTSARASSSDSHFRLIFMIPPIPMAEKLFRLLYTRNI